MRKKIPINAEEDGVTKSGDHGDVSTTDPDDLAARDESEQNRADSTGGANGAVYDAGGESIEDSAQTLLTALKAEVQSNYDKYVRAVAELENQKKRNIKERSELIKYQGESLARDLLEVVDNLELALSKDVPGANEELIKGIRLVLDSFVSILQRHSIVGESALGKPFDPVKHEALATVPTDSHPPGVVMEEFKRAYFFKDKLLRPGQVVVAAQLEKPSDQQFDK